MTNTEKFKAAAHAIIDALPDGVRIEVRVTGEHKHAEVALNTNDEITWSSCDLRWASMTAWGGFFDDATPADLAMKLYEDAGKGQDPRVTAAIAAHEEAARLAREFIAAGMTPSDATIKATAIVRDRLAAQK